MRACICGISNGVLHLDVCVKLLSFYAWHVLSRYSLGNFTAYSKPKPELRFTIKYRLILVSLIRDDDTDIEALPASVNFRFVSFRKLKVKLCHIIVKCV